jgi:hypothetical protein
MNAFGIRELAHRHAGVARKTGSNLRRFARLPLPAANS